MTTADFVINEISNLGNKYDIFDESDISFLDKYFQKFHNLVELKKLLSNYDHSLTEEVDPTLFAELSKSVRKLTKKNREAAKLSHIFKKPHFKAFLNCLQEISSGDYIPTGYDGELYELELMDFQSQGNSLNGVVSSQQHKVRVERVVKHYQTNVAAAPDATTTVPDNDDDDNLQIIGLYRDKKQPLGMTVTKKVFLYYDQEISRCMVERILLNSLIHKQGLIQVGDIIFEVNDQIVEDPDSLQHIVSKSSGTITFKLLKSHNKSYQETLEKTFVKAYFDYDPEKDPFLPATSIGLPFTAGNVFEVINKDNENYWQALPLNSEGCQAYLIPSETFQERIIANQRTNCFPNKRPGSAKKSKKTDIISVNGVTEISGEADLRTYEEVVKVPAFRPPCLMLIGAEGLGKKTLKRFLVTREPNRFASPVIYTTDVKKGRTGHMFRNANRNDMVANNKYGDFVCVEEYNGELYGMKSANIRELIQQEKTVVIGCSPQHVYELKKPIYNPYVIFIDAPSLNVLEALQKDGLQKNLTQIKRTEMDFRRIIQQSAVYKNEYKHIIDCVIVNNGVNETYRQILDMVNEFQNNDAWIPVSWQCDIIFLQPYKAMPINKLYDENYNSTTRRYEKRNEKQMSTKRQSQQQQQQQHEADDDIDGNVVNNRTATTEYVDGRTTTTTTITTTKVVAKPVRSYNNSTVVTTHTESPEKNLSPKPRNLVSNRPIVVTKSSANQDDSSGISDTSSDEDNLVENRV